MLDIDHLLFQLEEKFFKEAVVSNFDIVSLLSAWSTLIRQVRLDFSANELLERVAITVGLLNNWIICREKIDEKHFLKLCEFRNEITTLYNVSPYYGQKVLLRLINTRSDADTLKKFSLCLSLNSIQIKIAEWRKILTERELLALILSMMSERIKFDTLALPIYDDMCEEIIQNNDIIITAENIVLAHRVYMNSTYLVAEKKDIIKAMLADGFRKYLLQKHPELVAYEDLIRNRRNNFKRIMVIHEHFRENHAMQRCFGPYIKDLNKSAEVIGVGLKSLIDHTMRDYHSIVEVVDTGNYETVVDLVVKYEPDIIYYPSIGMTSMCTLLSQLRLAPRQIMTYGHPSSAFSKNIDYGILDSTSYSTPGPEYLIGYDAKNHGVVNEVDMNLFANGTVRHKTFLPKKLKVCINAKIFKLNPVFLDLLRKIFDRQSNNITLHFFPGERGLQEWSAKALLTDYIGEVKVHPYYEYETFLEHLSGCDLSLCPFPFGNTNSLVDAISLGIPVIAMQCDEICSSGEEIALKSLELEDFLMSDIDEYIAVVERFISDPMFRKDVKLKLNKAQKMMHKYINKPAGAHKEFLKVFENAV